MKRTRHPIGSFWCEGGTAQLLQQRFMAWIAEASAMGIRQKNHAVFRAGEFFPRDPAITEAEAELAWVDQSQAVMVAVDTAEAVLDTDDLRPNSLALADQRLCCAARQVC